MIYRLDNFVENKINPITGCAYDASWQVLMLTESDQYKMLVGSKNGGPYSIKLSRIQCKEWMLRVGDLIDFSEKNGKNVILVMPETDYLTMQSVYAGHAFQEKSLRWYEPSVLIHSTGMENWISIQKDGMLKSWNKLHAEGKISEEDPIGSKLGDPVDYRNYIMFGSGFPGEIVVQSKQKGKIIMDADAEYLTGARLYFDAEKMAQDGLLIRDGCHIKVKDILPLKPYLLWAATWDQVGLESQTSTPRIFSEKADRMFQVCRHKETGL